MQTEANGVLRYMDLRRQVFPSPVAYTNQLNVVTTCQSSTCVTSCIAQPANTPVYATASIRSIRPNFVKSRAQAFEEKDSDEAKVLVPAKTVIGGNLHSKTAASPSPVNVTVGSRHSVVQPSKSVGYLEHIRVSPVGQRDKTPQFVFDTERSPFRQSPSSPVHHNFYPGNSAAVNELVSSEMSSDVVAQRLKLFEKKPVMSNKPAILPKPRGPRSDYVANRVSIFRSRSSDSVTQSEVESVSSQDSPWRMANKNLQVPANDVGERTTNADRQRKEIVINSSSSSYPDVSKVLSPKRPQKPQATEVVGRPPSFSRKVKELVVVSPTASPSSSDTSKIVSQQAPKKPPRMTVVDPPSVTATCDDSYGLLVYAAGAATPSVHIEKLSPDVAVVDGQSLHNISNAPAADQRSHVDRQMPTSSVPAPVRRTSRRHNTNAHRSSAALRPSPVNDAWENKFIRAPKNTPVFRSKGQKENFVTKNRMNNPSYMYVSMHVDDVIPSRQKIITNKHILTRHHSDEMLNIPPSQHHTGMPTPKSPNYKEPTYSVPFESATENSVKFDSAGYAMPHAQDTPQFKVTDLLLFKLSYIKLCVIQHSSLLLCFSYHFSGGFEFFSSLHFSSNYSEEGISSTGIFVQCLCAA